MKLQETNLSDIFKNIISKDKYFQLALKVVKENSLNDNIWVIGSFIYKNLADYFYENINSAKDIDFIVEKISPKISIPDNWTINKTRFGNPRLKNNIGIEIDIIPLEEVYVIKKRKLSSSIENYLSGVPLNITSFAYDINKEKIEGIAGIESLGQKIVRINDLEMAQETAKIYETTVNEMIKKKANELKFKAELIAE